MLQCYFRSSLGILDDHGEALICASAAIPCHRFALLHPQFQLVTALGKHYDDLKVLHPMNSLSSSAMRGILLVIAATLLFASMDSAGKYLMTKYNVPFVATVRFAINLVLLVGLAAPRHGARLWQTSRTGLVLLRAGSLSIASLFSGLALQRMPVGETVAILYLQGFGVMLVAGWLLKEKVSVVGWLCATVGFAGVVLIARPGGALVLDGVAYAVIAAAVSVIYILLSRTLATSESTMAMLFYVALIGTVTFGIMLVFNLKTFSLLPLDFLLLAFLGIGSLLGHYLFTQAYRFAPASILAPFSYLHIAFAVIMSWLIYQHVPDLLAFVGMAMIAVSGVAIAIYTHLNKSKEIA